MNIQNKAQKGFTLIELMIVIAIVGILAAIALPAYQDYIVRSKMSEALAAMAEAKTTVAEYVAANGEGPSSASKYGVTLSTRQGSTILRDLDILPDNATLSACGGSGCTFYITANVYESVWGATGGDVGTFSLSGQTHSDGTMTWTCVPGGDATADAKAISTQYLPANCRG